MKITDYPTLKIYRRLLLLLFACLSLPVIAKAQGSIGGNLYGYYGNGYGYRSSAAAYYNPYSRSVSRSMRTVFARRRAQSNVPQNSPRPTVKRPVIDKPKIIAGASTSFRPASSPIAPLKLAKKLGKGSLEEDRKWEEFFAFTLQGYETIAKEKGAPLDDVAHAMNYFIHNNYMVYHDGQGMSDEQFEGLSTFVRESLLEDEDFQHLSARNKQEMYEMVAIMGGVTLNGYTYARDHKDPKQQAQMKSMAKDLLESYLGAPLDKIRFTANGIEY